MESSIKRILCPIDFSPVSTNAMEYAAKLSKQLNASLTLWNTCEIPIIFDNNSRIKFKHSIENKQNELTEILQDWCEEIKNEYAISCGYFIGSSVESLEKTLAHYTNGNNFDLIITGTNGFDNMHQFFFGTNSYRIMNEVECPVMIIPKEYTYYKIVSMIFVTDYSLNDVQPASNIIQAFNPNITFLQMIKKNNIVSKEIFKSFKNQIENNLKDHSKIKFESVMYENKLDDLIEKMIEKETDILVISTEKKEWLENLFHKNFTRNVLEGIQIPTIVFHKP